MRPLTELSSLTAVSNTDYSYTSPTYSVKAKDQEYLLISEISISGDSTFLGNGYMQIEINGENITNQNSPQNELQLINNYTFDFNGDKMFVYVEPGQKIIVNSRVSSGSGNMQVAILGMRLTKNEFEQLRNKFLGAK